MKGIIGSGKMHIFFLVSYNKKELKKVSTDSGLIKYLMRHWHSTPFEMCEIKYHFKTSNIYRKTMD